MTTPRAGRTTTPDLPAKGREPGVAGGKDYGMAIPSEQPRFGDYRDRRKDKPGWVQVSRVPREQYRTIKPLVGEKDCG